MLLWFFAMLSPQILELWCTILHLEQSYEGALYLIQDISAAFGQHEGFVNITIHDNIVRVFLVGLVQVGLVNMGLVKMSLGQVGLVQVHLF